MSIHHSFDFFIQWHLTERCNLACSHCYQTGGHVNELSYGEIEEVIEEIAETVSSWRERYEVDFSPSVNITGGEPFLREDLFKVLSSFHDSGFETYLLTNGILVDKAKAEQLFRAGVKGVQVSVEGPEKVHESIRGKHSFAASMRGVRCLLEAGLQVTLNSTISRLNAEYIFNMIELASGLGVHRLGFSRLVPSGRGETLLKEMLKTGEVKELYNKIFSCDHLSGLEIVTGDPVASQLRRKPDRADAGDVPLGGCAAGISGLTIMPDGTVVPCRRLPVPIGNVRKDSLREIWSVSPVLNDLRDRGKYRGKCGSCSRWANCRGCRAIAYSWSLARGKGDLLAPDPQCFL